MIINGNRIEQLVTIGFSLVSHGLGFFVSPAADELTTSYSTSFLLFA